MGHMPAIPASTRSSILLRLLDHAEKNWPQLKKVQARYRGPFAWITGVLPDGEQIPLFRLRYGGSAHSFGFAIYSAASDRYEDAVLITGLPVGTPQEALDTACTVHLAGLGHEPVDRPPTNLRGHPLSLKGGDDSSGVCSGTPVIAWHEDHAEVSPAARRNRVGVQRPPWPLSSSLRLCRLMDLGVLRRYAQVRTSALTASLVTAVLVILLGVLQGIIVAIVLAILSFFRRN